MSFAPFNVSIPSSIFIIHLVRVDFEIRKKENARDVNTQVVFKLQVTKALDHAVPFHETKHLLKLVLLKNGN